jgi:uncharacterized protein (TIGR03083 family)
VRELTSDRLAQALLDQAEQFADLVAGADSSVEVPSCPGWDLRHLVEHVGQAHRYATAMVRHQATGPGDVAWLSSKLPDGGSRDWLTDGAAGLVAAVREVGPDRPVWNFTRRPGATAAFWLRRMAHETAVHRADAALALARPYDLEPELAADALSEWLELVTSPGAAVARPELVEQLRGSGQTLHLLATDRTLPTSYEWTIHRGPDGVSWTPGPSEPGRGGVQVAAPVTILLLAVLSRVGPKDPRVAVTGDAALWDHWHTHVAF